MGRGSNEQCIRQAPSALSDQDCIARCQRCSQGTRLWSAGKHPLPIAVQRHIIIVTIVHDIRKRSTARHFQALALAAPDAERKRTCVSVSGKILACLAEVRRMDCGEELYSPTTELMAKLVSDEITKQRCA